MRVHFRVGILTAVPLVWIACMVSPAPALPDRTIEVHWGHPDASGVRSFRIYWGVKRGEYLAVREVMPPPEPDGTFLAKLTVPLGRTVHVAVTAVGPGGESRKSNRGICEPGCTRARPRDPVRAR